MKQRKIIRFVVFNILAIATCFAHGEHAGIGVVFSFPTKYDFTVKEYSTGFNVNGIFELFNGSIEQSSLIHGNDNRVKGYVGIGMGPLIEVQYGFHSALRIRSDIVLFGDLPPVFSYFESKWAIFRKGIVISPTVDFNLKGSKATQVAVGIGVYL